MPHYYTNVLTRSFFLGPCFLFLEGLQRNVVPRAPAVADSKAQRPPLYYIPEAGVQRRFLLAWRRPQAIVICLRVLGLGGPYGVHWALEPQ